MNKPELLLTTRDGGTVHSYEIEGGKTTFQRYLGCYLGSCSFHNTLEEAKEKISLKF